MEATEHASNITIIPFPTHLVPLLPAIPIKVELGLTVTYTVLYSCLFLIIYLQLCMIIYYKYKRLSYQSILLILCLIWAALRTVLFSFYFKNVMLVNNLSACFYWLLYCFPICLQFIILSLMVVYFSHLYFKIKYRNEPHKYRMLIRSLVLLAVVMFTTINAVFAVIQRNSQALKTHECTTQVILTRVILCQLLFMIEVISLSIFIIKIARNPNSRMILEAKGITLCQAVAACVILILLFTSRAAYNFIVVILRVCNCYASHGAPTFNFSWINISDQADVAMVKGSLYVTFGVVLFLWEFLPTFTVVLLYRVRRPPSTPDNMIETSSQSYSSKVYFFDNPRRYDSDEELHNPSLNSSRTDIRSSSGSVFGSSARSIYGRYGSSLNHGASVSPSNLLSTSPYYQQYNSGRQSHSMPSTSRLLINPVNASPSNV